MENNSIIARGATDLVYKCIEPKLSDYIGKVFEDICKQYLWKLLLIGKCPVEFTSLGRWWGNDPIEKSQAEIDIMGEVDCFLTKMYICIYFLSPDLQKVASTKQTEWEM